MTIPMIPPYETAFVRSRTGFWQRVSVVFFVVNWFLTLQLSVTHDSTCSVMVALLQLHEISVAEHGEAAIAVVRQVSCRD